MSDATSMDATARPATPPAEGAAVPKDDTPKGWWTRTRESFQSAMPQWVRDNSTRINQLGLMFGTAVIIGSVFRGKKISQDIFDKQKQLLQESGLAGEALEKKIAELIESKVMKTPGLHRQRMFYLPTAVAGLAIGGFIKDKETPEDRAAHKHMSLPEYMGMRLKQSFDPLHHSRQTAGVVGAASGVLAIISAFSQPGGVLKSEAVVGATLIAGFTGLTFIDDPNKAKQALNICWATRLPVVVTGTYETLLTQPAFKHPLTKMALKLPYKRMDISYPIGQWFNMAMATFGFLMAGSDEKKKADAHVGVAVIAPDTKHERPAEPDKESPQTTITANKSAQLLQGDAGLAMAKA